MKMFVLKCKLAPDMQGPQARFAGGYGTVWVWTDSADRVESAAEEYLLRYGWMLDERESIHEISLEHAQSDTIHYAHYLKAQRQGAAAEISCFERYAK